MKQSAIRIKRSNESIIQTNPKARWIKCAKRASLRIFCDSDIEKYIRASHLLVSDAATTRKRERSIESSPLILTSSSKQVDRHKRKPSLYRGKHSANCGSALNLFGEDWLKDANCVGQSVAEI